MGGRLAPLTLLAWLLAVCACATSGADATAQADQERKLRELRQRQDRLERKIADLDTRVALLAEKVDRALPRQPPELEVIRLPPPQSPPDDEAEIDEVEPATGDAAEDEPAIELTLPASPAGAGEGEDVKGVYDAAQRFFREGRFEAALEIFAQIAARHPSHSLADNAVYWQGVCLYEMGHYAKAIDQLQKVAVLYPQSPKVPDALLKTGEAYRTMGDKVSARVYLSQVIEQYPRSEAAKKAANLLKPTTEGR